ncbi:MAG: hypothetical protein MJ090_03220 [Clostridia bacterium]|nr:hypothetical protein [Clostridia bacterium]
MPCFKIADFTVDFNAIDNLFEHRMTDYRTDDTKADISIEVTKEDINQEILFDKEQLKMAKGYVAEIAGFRKLGDVLPLFGAFVFHSVVLDIEGNGIAFAARSGTGKTTHMLNWQKLLGEKMTIVNGDKPIIRFFDDKIFAYGTPWTGKEKFGTNTKTELKHLCFIERADKNETELLDKKSATELIASQVYMPRNPKALNDTLSLIDRLLENVKIWKIKCNKDVGSALTAYNTIFDKSETEENIISKTNGFLEIKKSKRTFLANWTPTEPTNNFEISLPFTPQKIFFYCNDAFAVKEDSGKPYYCNLTVDFSSRRHKINGLISKYQKVIPLGLSKADGLISLNDNVFKVNPYECFGEEIFFHPKKKYSFIAIE